MNSFRTILRRHYGNAIKYPLDADESIKLPVFHYNTSNKRHRRVFAWGNIHTGALGIPYFSKNESIKHIQNQKFPKHIGFGEKHEVTSAACGFGFSVFSVISENQLKIYGTGINTDSQIGYHGVRCNEPLEILYYPKPITLPLQNPEHAKVIKLSAGRAHLLVLTNEGLFTLGNNAYGQCGRKLIRDENYLMSNHIHHIKNIDGKQIIDIECGQDHSIALTEDGKVYTCGWGADGQTGLEHFNCCYHFTEVKGDLQFEKIVKLACRADFVLALNNKGDVFGWGNTEYGQLPCEDQQVAVPTHIKTLSPLGRITSIGSGGSMCIVATKNGQVFSWGYGLLGTGRCVQQSKTPVRIPENLFGQNTFQPDTKVTEVVCGLYHAAAINNHGDAFLWGRNKNNCLGLGSDKDQYFPLKLAISGVTDKIYCGVDHTVALCRPFI